jgi:flagellar motor switch/type III secretory pathway protein FliN
LGCSYDTLKLDFQYKKVVASCTSCGMVREIKETQYHLNWGIARHEEKNIVEWLHDKEGRSRMEKMKISFIDVGVGVTLGSITVPFEMITKLNVGDVIEFKDSGILFGLLEILSFAVNQGFPEGHINVKQIKPKAKIKLHEINDEYIDSLIPF